MPVARYSVSFGLAGCYLPDNVSGPYIIRTRRDLANLIRDELAAYDLPASLFREVRIKRLWQFIKRHGSSAAHFSLTHGANALSFHGLTKAEADEMERYNEW